jgi:hypothetical protein
MAFDDRDFDEIYRTRSRLEAAGGSALRIALLFGSVAVALALIVTQILDNRFGDHVALDDAPLGIDFTSTGSIGYTGTYTIRKSVLQSSPNSVCIVRDNGIRSGDC